MAILQYVDAHPWWTLVYLLATVEPICWAVANMGPLIKINSGMNSGQITRK